MKLWRISLALVTVGMLALPAPAGILFGKKTKPNPAERVPELIVIVKTDKDESKRTSAAEELRQYDPATHPDIVPVLIDVLLNDAKPAVRVEAAESLAKLRPVSQEAGWALEQARDKDSSMRVRAKARYELIGYYWAGYHTDPKLKDGAVVNPKDVPMEKGKAVVPAPAGSGRRRAAAGSTAAATARPSAAARRTASGPAAGGRASPSARPAAAARFRRRTGDPPASGSASARPASG